MMKSEVAGLKAIDGTVVTHHGKVELRAKRGDNVMQFAAEVADVDYPVLSTDAITRSGRSVLHSPDGDWIIDGIMQPPVGMHRMTLQKHESACYLGFDEILQSSLPSEMERPEAYQSRPPIDAERLAHKATRPRAKRKKET